MDDQAQATSPKQQIPIDPIVDPVADLEELTKNPVPTLAQEVAAFENAQIPNSTTPGGKEMEPVVESRRAGEPESISEVEEIPESLEMEGLEGYIEKVERAAETQQAAVDDYTQQIHLGQTDPTKQVLTLPLTEDQIVKGLHHKVWDGIRWLAEWCVRMIKILHGRVRFKQDKS